jgi:hypothetical protein
VAGTRQLGIASFLAGICQSGMPHFSVFVTGICQLGMPSFSTYSRLAYAIREWEALAYIRDWHPSHSRMAYASQEQALRPPIHEWHMPFVNGGGRIREWDNSWLGRNISCPEVLRSDMVADGMTSHIAHQRLQNLCRARLLPSFRVYEESKGKQ